MEKNTPFIVSVTGWSGSGKTTFCEKLISELSKRGKKVAAAKNAHKNLRIDKPGSDSDRYFNAGAESVCLNAENMTTVFFHERIADGNGLYSLFPKADIIIAEGFKADGAYRVEVTGMAESIQEMKNPAAEADMIVYGNTHLRQKLAAGSGTAYSHTFIERNDISGAADIICAIT
ncbi:MAG: molybdopterin-guanine dinucleotide biosynthesis protein B [Spirochaetales bacterium]|uniref:Molybdopterin-guanine dinucleotide biosynthesis protein B n=1 Tax=Candidatus Thalassospirochaeta sargassi TaxID=3119039 RepID=A0AAJ1MK66_9SPIO|nr:molybdopterin-guanine dinucleotide biosynthesis protein B [Spirochaetales bacterium]